MTKFVQNTVEPAMILLGTVCFVLMATEDMTAQRYVHTIVHTVTDTVATVSSVKMVNPAKIHLLSCAFPSTIVRKSAPPVSLVIWEQTAVNLVLRTVCCVTE